jgi:hypothetical protein
MTRHRSQSLPHLAGATAFALLGLSACGGGGGSDRAPEGARFELAVSPQASTAVPPAVLRSTPIPPSR